jgi:hypothetical protein
MPGDYLDLSSSAPEPPSDAERDGQPRGFLGVHFACCDVYARVYANRSGAAYVGHCPRCAKRVQFKVGPGGTDARFFVAQ